MSRFSHYEQCPRCAEKGHDSRGDNLACYSDGGAHCFSCGYHRFERTHLSSRIETNVRTEDKAKLPHDFTREVPTHAWKWLLQYGLPMSHWKDKVGWSEHHQRLVFLIGDPLQFSIGRWLPREGVVEAPKTLSEPLKGGDLGYPLSKQTQGLKKPERKWYVWGNAHAHVEFFGPPGGGTVVLVEDLLSANKVGASGRGCIPLFGTNPFHPCFLYFLRQHCDDVVLWLDKDQELNMKKTALRLSLLTNKPVRTVVTEKDPKLLSFEDIKNILENT